jgi:hypothetical protein
MRWAILAGFAVQCARLFLRISNTACLASQQFVLGSAGTQQATIKNQNHPVMRKPLICCPRGSSEAGACCHYAVLVLDL